MIVWLSQTSLNNIMFLCETCVVETREHLSSELTELSILSDDRDLTANIQIMAKSSLYNKYLQKTKKEPFTDPEFPPNGKSMGFKPEGREVCWKRVSEIVEDCLLFEGGIEETDVQAGNIGDVYFLPTVAALARYPNRIRTVFYHAPAIHKQGIYCLLVKQGGVVREMVIDDHVPVYRDSGRPAFCKANGREVWVMLLEKAWAKLKGSYGALLTGCPHEVLTAFCIGPCFSYDLSHKSYELQVKLWSDLKHAYRNRYIICATSSLNPQKGTLPGRRIFTLLGLSELKGRQQIKLRNCWSEEMPTAEKMARLESPDKKSVIYSPFSKATASSVLRPQNEDLIFSLNEFVANFDRLDISHDNGTFNYEFQEIAVASSPVFVEFEVQEEHEAYICVTKIGSPGSLRLLLASSSEEEGYQLEAASSDTQFVDCLVHMARLPIRRHVLMINAELHGQGPHKLTLGYSWKGVSLGSRTMITQMDPKQIPLQSFLNSLFLNRCAISQEYNALTSENDLVRNETLFEQCGYGYVACRVPAHSKFHLEVLIDSRQIAASGLRMLSRWGEKEIVRPGEEQVFVFELASEELDTDFPPKGFSISKII